MRIHRTSSCPHDICECSSSRKLSTEGLSDRAAHDWNAGAGEVCEAHAARGIPDFMPERSRHMELGHKAQQGRTPAAATPKGYAAAHAEKERQAKGGASPMLSERQRLIPAWKPTDEARSANTARGASSASPGLKGGLVLWACFHTILSIYREGRTKTAPCEQIWKAQILAQAQEIRMLLVLPRQQHTPADLFCGAEDALGRHFPYNAYCLQAPRHTWAARLAAQLLITGRRPLRRHLRCRLLREHADCMAPLCRLRAEAQGSVGSRAGRAAPADGPAPLQAAPRAARACSRRPAAGQHPSHSECLCGDRSALHGQDKAHGQAQQRLEQCCTHANVCPC